MKSNTWVLLTVQIKIQPQRFVDLQVGIAYSVIGALGFGIARYFPKVIDLVPPCLFRYFTGIPCPACGATTSGFCLSQFQMAGAFRSNPFFCGLFFALVFWGINTFAGLVLKKNLSFSLSANEQRILRLTLILAFFSSWLYLVLTALT